MRARIRNKLLKRGLAINIGKKSTIIAMIDRYAAIDLSRYFLKFKKRPWA